jgi:outer membrane protein TolC
VAQTRIMIEQWQHARDRRDRYAREIVPLAHERTVATLVGYRGGRGSLVDVFAVRREEADAQMRTVESERDAARLWAKLNFALPDMLPSAARTASREEAVR